MSPTFLRRTPQVFLLLYIYPTIALPESPQWVTNALAAPDVNSRAAVAVPPVQEQTVDGVTLRISEVSHRDQYLRVRANVTADPQVVPTEAWKSLRLVGRVFGPDGRFLGKDYDSIDPSLPYVTLKYEFLLPNAPPEATGQRHEEVEIKGIELPRKLSEVVPINYSVTTTLGTKIRLTSVSAWTVTDAEGGVSGVLRFTTRIEAPARAPDMSTGLTLLSIEDAEGTWKSLQGANPKNTSRYFRIPMPPGGVKRINLRLAVRERALSLRDPRWIRRFSFNLKMPPVPESIPVSTRQRVYKVEPVRVENELVEGSLEAGLSGNSRGLRWQSFLWLKDKSQPNDPNLFWYTNEVEVRDPATQNLLRRWGYHNKERTGGLSGDVVTPRRFWKPTGERVEPKVRMDSIGVSFDGTRPKTVDAEATVVAARRFSRFSNFIELPVPHNGATIAVNRKLEESGLTVLSVQHITPPEPEPGVLGDGSSPWRNVIGQAIELIVKYDAAAPQRDYVQLTSPLVTDSRGFDMEFLDVQEVSSSPREVLWRVTVQALPPGATSFNIQLVVDEFATTGQTAKLLFRNVPVPPTR